MCHAHLFVYKWKLPLPQALSSMFLENKYDVDRVDDPEAHDGRLRSFPHQRGQWSTLVFEVYLSGLKVFTNDEKTRTFLTIPVVSGIQELLKIFWAEASFHVSIAWCLGDKSEELNNSLSSLLSTLDQLGVPECWPLTVSQVECRMGNRITSIFL
ncbi:hypothetical protein B566_EDAN017123 [Ephemera danica]|nr:hypothetical protein B566_EDAN017123 [Ephemera danica]